MVTVKCFHLLRSKYGIEELTVKSGTVRSILDAMKQRYPSIDEADFTQAIMFINQEKVMHLDRFDECVEDGDVVIFTNFVGGG